MPAKKEMPSTLQRSSGKARELWGKAHDSAVDQYGEGERAHRTAFSALKHSFKKVGDHWEPKAEKGPSDPQSAQSGSAARNHPKKSAGGVDASQTKEELMKEARRLGMHGYSSMRKSELIEALKKESRRQTAKARKS
jgi:cation transport regulator ChaB